jgi:hypothetical protein
VTDHTCPLLALTRIWDENDTFELVLKACGELLWLRHETYTELPDGERHSTWRVECGAGHVLVVEDCDDGSEIPVPVEESLVAAAIERISVTAAEDDRP